MQTRTLRGSYHPIISLPLTLHVYQISFSTIPILHPFFGSSLSGPASSSSIGARTPFSLIPVSNTHQDGNTARVYSTQSRRFLHSFFPTESPLFQKNLALRRKERPIINKHLYKTLGNRWNLKRTSTLNKRLCPLGIE